MSRSREAAPETIARSTTQGSAADFATLAALLVLFAVIAYGRDLALAFIGDDYVFLERVLREPLSAVASPHHVDFGWYRPWSRDLHFWILAHLGPLSPLTFRIAGIALWAGALALFFSIALEVAPWTAAVLATLGVAALPFWGTPILWISGSQDLWMLVFALGALKLHARGRPFLAATAFALALLSKETAAVVPLLLLAWSWIVERSHGKDALRRLLPSLAALVLWAVLHPTLRTRFFHPDTFGVEVGTRPSPPVLLRSVVGALVGLDRLPRPFDSPGAWILPVTLSSAVLVLGTVWLLRRGRRGGPGDSTRAVRMGVAWTVIGSLPLLLPSISWHAYYGCLGALGAWLVIGTWLAHRPRAGVAVIGLVAIVRGLQTETPSWDWGNVWYERRAAHVVTAILTRLSDFHPTLPHHTRIYFGRIPNNVGLVAGKSPAVRVLYRDSTLFSDFFSAYRPRTTGEPAGADLFFRFDTLRVLVPVGDTGESATEAMRENPEWLSDQLKLAYLFLEKGDPGAAGRQFELIAHAPGQEDAVLFAGVCWRQAGETGRADSLFRAARRTLGRDSTEIAGIVRDLTASMPRFATSAGAPPADEDR